MNKRHLLLALLLALVILLGFALYDKPFQRQTPLAAIGLALIPYPQQVELLGSRFELSDTVRIILDADHSAADRATAEQLASDLKARWDLIAQIDSSGPDTGAILLTRKAATAPGQAQGYHLRSTDQRVTIEAADEAGLFYGTQTLLQLIGRQDNAIHVAGVDIVDWPDIPQRAVHYDTKHHQDKAFYVRQFIRDLAAYKINMLVWEWEDKFAYRSHPEIGAPGAFSMEEMQEFTRYARRYHIQLVPLVQGLGHASFMLKWEQHAHLREIASSNWQFCPQKEGTYELLFELWEEAIEATPGSDYIHIGSDETYETGSCEQCQARAEQIGKSGLYHEFVGRAARQLQQSGRKVMVWETPMGWEQSASPARGVTPAPGLVLTESYGYETSDFFYAKQAKSLGYEVFAYDPNPGIPALFLPYFKKQEKRGFNNHGSLKASHKFLESTAGSGVFDGMINTSWDDAGLHNQMWMLSFVTSAEYAWSGQQPSLREFTDSFFRSYYGVSEQMKELFYLLNEGALYYMSTFERNVWHHGGLGKTHLPDLPRGDALEIDPFWNTRYADKIKSSTLMLDKMQRALQIIDTNRELATRNVYDFELFQSIATLIQHTAQTYLDLGELENTLVRANRATFIDREQAQRELVAASELVRGTLTRQRETYDALRISWEKTRLPKGLSNERLFFHQQDRARHFANRTADLSYLIHDERLLDLEGYLLQLNRYVEHYAAGGAGAVINPR